MRAWTTGLALALGVALVSGGSLAEATQSPAGCTNSGVGLDIQKSVSAIVNGQTVTYTVRVDNSAFPSCDAASVVVKAFCPDATGQPNILNTTYPTIASLPAPTATITLPTFSCVETVNPGVTSAIARASLSGVLHDNPASDDLLSVSKDLSVGVVTEGMSVSKSCTFADASTVNVSGTVSNTGTDNLVGLICTDDAGGTITPTSTSIPAGGSVSYTGSFSASSPHTDKVTCNATGQLASTPVGPASASATCNFIPPPPPPPPPSQIPTLSEWVMIMFAVFLALAGGVALRRKRIV